MIPATSQGALSCRRRHQVIRSVGRLCVKLVMLGGCFTEALALEREPVSVVHQPIENGIGERNGAAVSALQFQKDSGTMPWPGFPVTCWPTVSTGMSVLTLLLR